MNTEEKIKELEDRLRWAEKKDDLHSFSIILIGLALIGLIIRLAAII